MKSLVTLLSVAALALASAHSAVIETPFFTVTTPDDSWQTSDDSGAWGRMGTRMMLSRSDERRAALDLARIDYLEVPFTPESYLRSQVIDRRDIFCKSAIDIGQIADTTLLGREAKRIHFDKQANGHTYHCTALAMTVGFGTLFVIQGRQDGQPNVVGRLLGTLAFRCDTTALHGTAQWVAAAQSVLKRHTLASVGTDDVQSIAMPDSGTVEFRIVAPYLTRDAVDVPLFVQTKRAEWMRARRESSLTDLLLATAMTEQKQLRYVYVDDKGREIGTLLIMPEEYSSLSH